MQNMSTSHMLTPLISVAIVAILLALRMRRIARPFRVRPWPLVIVPVVMALMIGSGIWGMWYSSVHNHYAVKVSPSLEVLSGVSIIALLIGTTYGYWRANKLQMWYDLEQNSVMAQSSWAMMLVLLAFVVVRMSLRLWLSTGLSVLYVQIGCMLFALGLIIAYNATLWRRHWSVSRDGKTQAAESVFG
jgi:hypothetical protein